MVSDERVDKAISFLAATDKTSAEMKVDVRRKEYIAKKVRARMFLSAEGNNEARKALAEVSDEVSQAEEELAKAEAEYETVKAQRLTAALLVDVWRTTSANQRTGNI